MDEKNIENDIQESHIDANMEHMNIAFFSNNKNALKHNNSIIKKCATFQKPELFYLCLYLGYDPTNYKEYYKLFSQDNQKYIDQIHDLIDRKTASIDFPVGKKYTDLLIQNKLTIPELQDLLDQALINFNLVPPTISQNYINELLLYGYNPSLTGYRTTRVENIPKNDLSTLKIVVFSDTHNQYPDLPPGDVLIFCGDCCTNSKFVPGKEFKDFIDYFSKQPHQYKIIVPGNHDMLDLEKKIKRQDPSIIFLNNQRTTIRRIKFYGVSAIPFRKVSHNNNYSCNRRDMHYLLDNIPTDIDILITHFPAWGIGDYNTNITQCEAYDSGDYYLRKIVLERNLKYHLFGHAHGSTGIYKVSGKNTIFINTAQYINCFEI